MATTFVNPANTTQTKMVITNLANKLEGRITAICNDIKDILNAMYKVASFQLYLSKLLRAYNIYDIIYDQLQTGRIQPIEDDIIVSNVKRC